MFPESKVTEIYCYFELTLIYIHKPINRLFGKPPVFSVFLPCTNGINNGVVVCIILFFFDD